MCKYPHLPSVLSTVWGGVSTLPHLYEIMPNAFLLYNHTIWNDTHVGQLGRGCQLPKWDHETSLGNGHILKYFVYSNRKYSKLFFFPCRGYPLSHSLFLITTPPCFSVRSSRKKQTLPVKFTCPHHLTCLALMTKEHLTIGMTTTLKLLSCGCWKQKSTLSWAQLMYQEFC